MSTQLRVSTSLLLVSTLGRFSHRQRIELFEVVLPSSMITDYFSVIRIEYRRFKKIYIAHSLCGYTQPIRSGNAIYGGNDKISRKYSDSFVFSSFQSFPLSILWFYYYRYRGLLLSSFFSRYRVQSFELNLTKQMTTNVERSSRLQLYHRWNISEIDQKTQLFSKKFTNKNAELLRVGLKM